MKTLFKHSNAAGIAILFFSLITILLSGCGKEPSPTANEVWMQNNMFNPATITVSANTTVKWINKESVTHNVTSNTAGLFSSGNFDNGGTYSRQFTTAGSFGYNCTLHHGMTGTVIVQ